MRAINTIIRAGGLRAGGRTGRARRPASCTSASGTASTTCSPAASATTARCPRRSMDLIEAQDRYTAALAGVQARADAVDDAARHRRRQHAAVVGPGRLRRHQPGGRDQARRSRVVADGRASSPTSGCSCISWRRRCTTRRVDWAAGDGRRSSAPRRRPPASARSIAGTDAAEGFSMPTRILPSDTFGS